MIRRGGAESTIGASGALDARALVAAREGAEVLDERAHEAGGDVDLAGGVAQLGALRVERGAGERSDLVEDVGVGAVDEG